jgi:hypothetical protein
MYFYGIKEASDRKEMNCLSFGMIFRQQLRYGCNIVLLTCVSLLCYVTYTTQTLY